MTGTAAHITQSELESYLWGAATLLRGTIDAGDYKQFIFPLLFYKCRVKKSLRNACASECSWVTVIVG